MARPSREQPEKIRQIIRQRERERRVYRRKRAMGVQARGVGRGGGAPIHPEVFAATFDELLAAGWGNFERSKIPADWRTRQPAIKFDPEKD